jgi:hypothetical protein
MMYAPDGAIGAGVDERTIEAMSAAIGRQLDGAEVNGDRRKASSLRQRR